MGRLLALAATVGAGLAGGCASGWDTLTSRRMWDRPWATLSGGDDPMTVLRTSPVGDDRARAMLNLREPAASGKDADQDEAVQLLTEAATADPSPWVRLAAVDALGRFHDPRAGEALVAAYFAAPNRPVKQAPAPVRTASDRTPTVGAAADLRGPQGFPADQVASLRVKVLDGLARHAKPSGVSLLGRVANNRDLPADDDPASRDVVRQAAVRNLATVRQPEAVQALAQVLAAEANRDITVAALAHDGLKTLTGKDLPADSKEWQGVVQAGGPVAPEANAVRRAVGLDAGR